MLLLAAGCQAPGSGDPGSGGGVSTDTQTQITDSLVLAAEASEASGDWAGATKYWSSLLERDPDRERYAIGVGDGLRHTGRYEDAVQVLLEARRRHPESAAVLSALGKAQLAAGRREEAIVSLTEASALAPEDWRSQSALAVAYSMVGQSDLADHHYRQALALDGGNAVILNNYALHLAITGRLEEGLVVMDEAAGTFGAPSQVRQNQALLLAIAGRIGEAEEIVRAELPREPADRQMAFLRTLSASDLVNLDDLIDQSSLTIESDALVAPSGNLADLTNLGGATGAVFLEEQPAAARMADGAAVGEVVVGEAAVAPAADPPPPPPEPAALETAVIAAPSDGSPTPAQESAAVTATLADLLETGGVSQSLVVAPLPEPDEGVAVPAPEPEAGAAVAAPEPAAPEVAALPAPEPSSPAAAGSWRVQIASLPTEELARRGRDDLLAEHPAVLGAVEVEVVSALLDSGGTTWRVYAGRFAERSGAAGLCEALRSAGGDCFVMRDAPGG